MVKIEDCSQRRLEVSDAVNALIALKSDFDKFENKHFSLFFLTILHVYLAFMGLFYHLFHNLHPEFIKILIFSTSHH